MTASTATPQLRQVFRQPLAEQAAFWRNKLSDLRPTQRWNDLLHAEHDSAFMIAGATQADLLSDFAAAVDRAIVEGTSLQDFRRDFDAIVDRHGWAYTGERNWRTRVIYRTNAATSYAAGRLAQLQEFPFWMYRHGGSADPRPQHLAWDGLVLPSDHPFWSTHAPPNGWGCSCRIVGLRRREDAIALGGDPNKPLPADWDTLDARTLAPIGIDKGWAYQPGASVVDLVTQMAAKTQQWAYTLAKAYMQNVPNAQRDALARSYRSLPSLAIELRRYADNVLAKRTGIDLPQYRTLGLLTRSDADRIGEIASADVTFFDYALDRSSIAHVFRKHGDQGRESTRGQRAVTADDFARLPAVINEPDGIEAAGTSDVGRPVVRFEKQFGDELLTAAFEVRAGRKMLALQSLWIRSP